MAEHEEKHGEKQEQHGGGGGGGHGRGHGGGGHAEGEHEGAPEWLISFADNVALMMGFFVILLAMNMGPKGSPVQGGAPDEVNNETRASDAWKADFVLSIRDAFNNPVDIFSDKPEDQPLIRRMLERRGGLGAQDGPRGRYEELQAIRPSDYNNITASIAFDDRSALLDGDSREIIAQTGLRLRDQRWVVEVRGHVSPYESMRNHVKAMQLSYERSLAVAQVLAESGVRWENLRIVACGDGDKVVPLTFDRDQNRTNQRVEIVVTNDLVPTEHDGANRPGPGSEPAAPAGPADRAPLAEGTGHDSEEPE